MMVCLIAIPLVALFGTSLPDVVKAVKEGRWPTLTGAVHALLPTHNPDQDQNRNQNALEEPAKFEPAGEPLPTGPAAMLAGPANINAAAPAAPLPIAAAGASDPPPMAPRWTAESTPRQTPAVVPAGYEAAIGAPAHAAPSALPAATTSKPADPFLRTQQRLQQLGATYYLLESWGGQQQLYRFYCKMAVGGNPNYTRYFEAIESDPLRAMSEVLGQVESWRAGRM
jgi:hypothetical protein